MADTGLIDGFLRNDHEMIGGEVADFKGTRYAHLRTLVPSATTAGEWVRTERGVAIEASRFHELATAIRKLENTASTNVVVAKIATGSFQTWVGLSTFKNEVYVNVRRYYRKGANWLPTQKGVNVRVELLEDLLALVTQIEEAC